MKIAILGAVGAASFATAALAQAMSPAEYVAAAGAGDLYERMSSQIVLETSSDPRIRDFAQMMIADHGKSSAMVMSAARSARVRTAPPRLMPAQAEMIAQLRAETGAARDGAYLAQQRQAHGQALNIQKAYADGGTVAPLRRAAAAAVPVVEHHIEMLKAM